jgi:hypothetical protein
MSAAAAIKIPLAPKQPADYRKDETRKLLIRTRKAAGDGWPYARYGPIPQESIYVDDAHSNTQQGLMSYFRATVQARTGKLQGVIHVSLRTLSRELKKSLSTIARNLAQLQAKHSIRIQTVRTRGEHGPGNREATVYVIPTHVDVLEARRNDPLIGTTHGEADRSKSRQWTNGRRDSRRLLTPEEIGIWGCAKLPAKPGAAAPAKHEPPPVADADRAAPQPARATTPAIGDPPARGATPPVPPDQQEALNQLCGMVMPPGSVTKQWPLPAYCDLSGQILAGVQSIAQVTERQFPPDKIAGVCEWIFEKKSKLADIRIWDPLRHEYRLAEVRVWTAGMPAAYLLACMRDVDKTQDLILRYLDALDKQKRRDAEKTQKDADRLRDEICEKLGYLHKHPGDKDIERFLTELKSLNPTLYGEVEAEEARRRQEKREKEETRRAPA